MIVLIHTYLTKNQFIVIGNNSCRQRSCLDLPDLISTVKCMWSDFRAMNKP